MTTANPTKAERIQTFNVTQPWYDRVEQYADDNSLSISESFVEILTAYANGDVPPPKRQRRSRRVAIWIAPSSWSALRKRASKDGVTIADAIEAAMDAAL